MQNVLSDDKEKKRKKKAMRREEKRREESQPEIMTSQDQTQIINDHTDCPADFV